jgi:CheY-like chemotaxis protein
MTKVLYVEDNDDNVYMLKMRLELLGDFEVLAAEDGEKGCEIALPRAARYYPDGPGNACH